MSRRSWFLSALGATVIAVASLSAQAPKSALPDGIKMDKDVAYDVHGERTKLDVYYPEKADKPLPLVVWVHGGGWTGGSKAGGAALPLLAQGYAVASINYRFSTTDAYPAQIFDCKSAIRHLRANAKKYNVNPDRIGVWGASAGGHLVALLGTTGDVKELEGKGPNAGVSSRVQAVCDWFGPTDLLGFGVDPTTADNPLAKLLGGPLKDKQELAATANPITYVTADDAPFYIIHGDMDKLVPLNQSEKLHAALQKAGVESMLDVIKGVGHSREVGTPEVQKKTLAFFDKHLKK